AFPAHRRTAQAVQADSAHHRRQPGPQILDLGLPGPRQPQPALLHRVLGIGHAAGQSVADRQQMRPMRFEQVCEQCGYHQSESTDRDGPWIIHPHRPHPPENPVNRPAGPCHHEPMEDRVLTDGIVWLSRPRAADIDTITALCQEPSIGEWVTIPVPYRRTAAEGFLTDIADAGWANRSPV